MTTDITELAQKRNAAISRLSRAFEPGHSSQSELDALSYAVDVMNELVEALEKAQQRITQLEYRTVKLPKLKMLEDYLAEVAIEERKQILVGVKLEFHRACVSAGVKVEAE
ncbi:hypothetical protein ACNAUL_06535 [Raoultella ornithinolytica]|uniref:hypothetical protein n=1 Tax=Raoultella ornithinolytica TaxID=54291 RepID=UPI00229916FD|nr:hypothetical protein [Raoultella ornithinolytica]HDV9415353.1 hypothetical protein [Raoultella ornithinolytica]